MFYAKVTRNLIEIIYSSSVGGFPGYPARPDNWQKLERYTSREASRTGEGNSG
jgi:hypothetical protein